MDTVVGLQCPGRTTSGDFTGDGGPAIAGCLRYPGHLAFGPDSSLYIADLGNYRIRKVTPDGAITTAARTDIVTGGVDGVGGRPAGIVVDSAGNLYFADLDNSRIRKVSTTGVVTTIAGAGSGGLTGDGVQATLAKLSSPSGLALSRSGDLYFSDGGGHRVRKISPSGIITTVAGNGIGGFSGDGGPATSAELNGPQGIFLTDSGVVFIADFLNNRIRKVAVDGTITTFAGEGQQGFGGDGGLATAALLNHPSDVTIDLSGNVFVADMDSMRIRGISPDGVITTVAGNGSVGLVLDGGSATETGFEEIRGLLAIPSGDVLLADDRQNVIRKLVNIGSIGPCFYNLDPSSSYASSPPEGGTFSASVIASNSACPWFMRSPVNWIQPAPDRTQGSTSLSFAVSRSSSSSARSAMISVAGKPLSVSQQGVPCAFVANPPATSYWHEGGVGTISLNAAAADCSWRESTNSLWIFLTEPTSGLGLNSNLQFVVGENATSSSRTGTIDIIGPDLGVTHVTISQTGTNDVRTISPASFNVSANASTGSVSVTSALPDVTWTAISNATWLQVTGVASGKGSGTVTYSVQANASQSQRVGTITIAGKTFTVTQSGGVPPLQLTHIGNFTQGQTDATYVLSVFNNLTAGTSGTVTVTATFPAGLTATSLFGEGWSCTVSALCCVRSDALAPNSTYPTIIFTVKIASNALPTLVSQASLTGGGLPPSTVSDTTTILPAFSDVNSSDAFLPAIDLLRQYGITSSCGGSAQAPLFCPGDNVTRSQMAVFVVRSMMGGDDFTYGQIPYFTDVPASHGYFPWIQKLNELGVTSGCGTAATGSSYCPDEPVTRGQMAVFIIRDRFGASTSFAYPATAYFGDVPSSNGFFAWIQKLKQLGITSGCASTPSGVSYCPADPVTRGQMAVFIMRGAFNQLLPSNAPIILSVSTSTATPGQALTVTIDGQNTHFAAGVTVVVAGSGITVSNLNVVNPTRLVVQLSVSNSGVQGPHSITATTGDEEATLPNAIQVK